MKNYQISILNQCKDNNIEVLFYSKSNEIVKKFNLNNFSLKIGNNYLSIIDVDVNADYVIFIHKKIRSLPIYVNEMMPCLNISFDEKLNFTIDFSQGSSTYLKTGLIKRNSITLRKQDINYIRYHLYECKNKKDKYNLIIAFDSQNLFSKYSLGRYSKKHDGYNSWQIDQVIKFFSKKSGESFLVVGIDNSSSSRDKVLTLSSMFGKINHIEEGWTDDFLDGKLENYCKIIFEKIISPLKDQYDIDWNNVTVMGSSSGGLASYYYGNVYKCHNIMSFSPAFLLFETRDLIKIIDKKNPPRLILSSGNKDNLEKIIYESTFLNYQEMKKIYPKDRINFLYNAKYSHNELAWRYFFLKAFNLIYNK